MPEVNFTDAPGGTPAEVAADAAETAKIDAARAELAQEQAEADSGLILGKYETTDDLAAAYKQLQREYTSLKNGQGDQPADKPPVASEEPAEQEEAPEADDGAGLSEEQTAAIYESVLKQAGGEQEYKRLSEWATKNLDASRTEAFNSALETGNEGMIIGTLKGIQYDMLMSKGYEPKLTGGRVPTNTIQGFSSKYEIQQAMNDPKYAGDAAYRKEVERRIAVSDNSLFGM